MAAPSSGPTTSAFPTSVLPSSPRPASSLAIASTWTSQDDKLFEYALSLYDQDTHELWDKVSAMVPGKDPSEIQRHFSALAEDVKSIEAGFRELPNYGPSSFLVPDIGADPLQNACESPAIVKEAGNITQPSAYLATGGMVKGGNVSATNKAILGKPSEQERRKGIPWTEDEHRMFLLGLEKYGKGDWRSISRNYVISRTPTQVASHAQKYFIRLASMNKDKRRTSIHDITSVHNGQLRQQSHHLPITGQAPVINHHVLGQPVQHLPQQNSAGFGMFLAPVGKPIVSPTGSAVGTPIVLPSPGHPSPFSARPSPKQGLPVLPQTVPQAVYRVPQQAANQ